MSALCGRLVLESIHLGNVEQRGEQMGRGIKRVLGAAGTLALTSLGVLAIASPASADQCQNTRNVYIPGGESHYTISCDNYGHVIVDGWLKDTKADGKCVQVKAQLYGEYFYSPRACPKGDVKTFHFRSNVPTTYADVWTYTIG